MNKEKAVNSKPGEFTSSLKSIPKLKNRLGIFIAIFSFALYAQSISFDYALDDFAVIKDNELVKKGFSGIPALLTTDYWFGLNKEDLRVPDFRPVPMVIFAIEWQFFPDNPHFYHFINILLHALTCWLLFVLLCKLWPHSPTASPEEKDTAVRLRNRTQDALHFPFICVLLFASHPIHTEIVNSIKSLDAILCLLFSILSIFCFIDYGENQSRFKMSLGILFFSLSLFSKESGISFLIVTPLILFMFSETKLKKILYITLALAVVTGLSLLIHLRILETFTENRIDTLHSVYMNSLFAAPDLISQKATAFFILLKYIFLLIFPSTLSYDYSFAQIPTIQASNPLVLVSIVCYLAMAVYAIINIRKKNPLPFAILFYLLTLAPASNVFLLSSCTMAERFLFMPSLGFCLALSMLLLKIEYLNPIINTQRLFKLKSEIFNLKLLPFIIVCFYSIRTIARSSDWKNNLTLFSHDVKIVPNSSRAHYNYGLELLYVEYPNETNEEKKNKLLDETIKELTRATTIYNNFPKAHSSLGAAYVYRGQYTKAIDNYEIAVRLFHPIPPADVFCDLGFLYVKTMQYDKALSILDSAQKYYPNYIDAFTNKSYAYLNIGNNIGTIAECEKVLKLDSENISAYINLGCAYLNLTQYSKAIEYLNKGLLLDSTNADCFRFLALAHLNKGDTLNAEKYYNKENEIRIKK